MKSRPVPSLVAEGRVVYAFDADTPPAWQIAPGSVVEVRCPDGLHGQIRSEDDTYDAVEPDNVNDAVGPIAVEGAMPGDMLTFEVLDIEVPQNWGYVLLIPGFGLLSEQVDEAVTRICRIDDGVVHFGDRRIPVEPCIGTIGVAPAGEAVSTLIPADHGGNMDTRDIRAGTTVYLPVAVPGGLLAMGDGKAAMGDGEVCGTGVGVPLDILGRVDVLPGINFPRPVLESADEWQTIASAPTLEEATALAVADMIALVQRASDCSWADAYMLTSLVGMLRISQVVDPQMTVRMGLAKTYLSDPFRTGASASN